MRVAEMDWTAYFATQQGRDPRPLLLEALALTGPGHRRTAVDVGCGDGRDTVALLEAGWTVTAIDPQPSAIASLLAQVPAEHVSRLSTLQAGLPEATLPLADLLFASFSLPFGAAAEFPGRWSAVQASLRPGGLLAAELFGPADTYARDPGVTIHTREEVEALLIGWEVIALRELHAEGDSFEGPRHWHVFQLLARAPAEGDL